MHSLGTRKPRPFSEAMEELLEICEAQKAPKVVASSIAALIAKDERKLFCWMGNTASTDSHAGLYASDFLEELVIAVRTLDWERVVVLIHSPSPPDEVTITASMVGAGVEALLPYSFEFGLPEDYVRRIYRAMEEARTRGLIPAEQSRAERKT